MEWNSDSQLSSSASKHLGPKAVQSKIFADLEMLKQPIRQQVSEVTAGCWCWRLCRQRQSYVDHSLQYKAMDEGIHKGKSLLNFFSRWRVNLKNLPEAGPEDDPGPVDDPGPEYIKTIESNDLLRGWSRLRIHNDTHSLGRIWETLPLYKKETLPQRCESSFLRF